MPDPVQVRRFGVRFSEAIDNLAGKLPETSLRHDDLAGPVHAKVFTVAGSTSADLVRDLHQAIVEAKANGSTITDFRKDFDAAVQRNGWSYRGKRGWRTRVIFDTNMRSAHMAGRWQQLLANADRRPMLQYRTAGDARVRPAHRQWQGKIYPITDVFWQTHYPPNGWGCRCTVRAYGQAEMAAKGLQVSEPFQLKTRTVTDLDGMPTDQVPVGIDPGWDHNVGQSWLSPELALGRKLAKLPRQLQGAIVDKTITPAFERVLGERWQAFRKGSQAAGAAQILGFLDSATLDGLASAAPQLQLGSTAVAVFDSQAQQLSSKAPVPGAAAWTAEAVDALPQELRNYRAVLWDRLRNVLVVVPQGSGERLATAVLRPNVRTKFGQALAVEGLEDATAAELADSRRYQVLVGAVK